MRGFFLAGGWGLGVDPLLRVLPIMVPPLRRVTLANAGMPAQPKVTKGLGPGVRHLALARCSFVPGFIRGHRLRFASLHLLSMHAAAPHGRCAPTPRINPSTQPSDGAGTSKALLELTLIVLSGGERKQKQAQKNKKRKKTRKLSWMPFKTQVQLGLSCRRIFSKQLGRFPLPTGGPTFREG